MNIETELLQATGQHPRGAEETEQVYLNRIAWAVDDMPESVWDALSQDAKDWFNSASDVYDECKQIPAGAVLPTFDAVGS